MRTKTEATTMAMASALMANHTEQSSIEEGLQQLTLTHTQPNMEEASYERAVEPLPLAVDQLEETLQTATAIENNSSFCSFEEEEDILQERMEEVMHIKSRVRTVKLPPSLMQTYFDGHNPYVIYRRTIHLEGRSQATKSSSPLRHLPQVEQQAARKQDMSLLDSVESALHFYNMGLTFHLSAIAPTHSTTTTPLQHKRMNHDDNLRSALMSYQAALKILTAADVQHEEELRSLHMLWEMDRIDNCKKENAHYDDDDTSNNLQQFWLAYLLLRLALTNNITHIHAHFMNWTAASQSNHQTVDSINEGLIAGLFRDLLRRAKREHRDNLTFHTDLMEEEEEEEVDESRNIGNESVATAMQRDLLKLWSYLERPTFKLDTAPAA